MSDRLQSILERLIPFLIIGIALALLLGLFILLSYVFVWGLLLGGLLWAANEIKTYFSSSRKPKQGRVIEHDEKP